MREENILHYIMALVGGFFGGIAVCGAAQMFGNAMTLNLISVVKDAVYGDPWMVLLRVAGAFVYFAALALTVIIPRRTKLDLGFAAIAVDAVCLVVLVFMPDRVDPFVALYPVFFAAAFQWPVFGEIEGYTSATIFSSNNYRQFTTALLSYALDKKPEQLAKARVFGFTLLYFHLGVAAACVGALLIGKISALLGFIPLIIAAAIKVKTR